MAARSGSNTKARKTKTSKAEAAKWKSRAVLRLIEAGSTAECPFCGERVKFRARHRDQQVICNVYVDGKWDRVEQYHEECYADADKPHGKAIKKQRENLRQKAKEQAKQRAEEAEKAEEAKQAKKDAAEEKAKEKEKEKERV